MKIYALYYKDMFVVAFPTREDCMDYGKKHYEGMEWDCNVIEKYIHHSPLTTIPPYTTLTPSQTIPCKVSDVPYPFTIDYSQPPKANEWNETGDGA